MADRDKPESAPPVEIEAPDAPPSGPVSPPLGTQDEPDDKPEDNRKGGYGAG